MKMLVADDQQTTRNILRGLLGKWGFDVTVVNNGDDAWGMMRQEEGPILAILDWLMPGREGPEVCRLVRGSECSEKRYLILLTTKKEKSELVIGLEAGANDFISKPFDAGELRARVEVGVRFLKMQADLAERVLELEAALAQVKTLRGLLPICASCKKIRNDQGYWEQIEQYISQHADVDFTHGICPECQKKLYPDY